jgi:hypothetical protein
MNRIAQRFLSANLSTNVSVILGAWFLLTPPVPLGTSLPPVSQWRPVSVHKTSAECEQRREQMRTAARRTVSADPNATALKVASALGPLQARCVEHKTPPAAPASPAPAPPAPAAAK